MNLHFFRAHVLGLAVTSIPVITEIPNLATVKAPKDNTPNGRNKGHTGKTH